MKPIITSKLKIRDIDYVFDLELKDNMTLILGDSASGKTFLYKTFRRMIAKNNDKWRHHQFV